MCVQSGQAVAAQATALPPLSFVLHIPATAAVSFPFFACLLLLLLFSPHTH